MFSGKMEGNGLDGPKRGGSHETENSPNYSGKPVAAPRKSRVSETKVNKNSM